MKPDRSLPSVARSRRFQQALGRRLQVLDRDLAAALDHDVEALHRTRVASRRLREVLPVIEAPGAAVAAQARKSRWRVRRLTSALGGVRELDVALGLLLEAESDHPQLAGAADAVRIEIQRERAVRYAEMIRSLSEIGPGALARDIETLGRARPAPSSLDQRRRLRERVVRRARRLDAAVEAAGSLYAFDRLHIVRIAAKKLRYALELVQELTPLGTRRLVGRLKHFQDLLGRLHDLEVLAAYVRRVAGRPAEPLAAPAGRLLDVIVRETRELHAAYLGDVTALRAAAAAARDEVGPRLKRAMRRRAR